VTERKCSIIGALHVQPLPGSSHFGGSIDAIISAALKDGNAYKSGGVNAIIIENMHDTPYLKGFVYPETTAAMAVVARTLKNELNIPLGIQILAGANREALGTAIAAEADFLRVEGFVYAHVADEGIHESCAGTLIRRRSELKAERIKIFADIKKKHSAHAITSDVSLIDTAKNTQFFRADGVIITGHSTGCAPDPAEVQDVAAAVTCPVLVGSGVDADNIGRFIKNADALIVGSSLKFDGRWENDVDVERVKRLVEAASH